ncbi:transposase, MuDR, MULE transposase domain protein [Tanacetum coccineum]|uniref:Transposase, MuDR, MULE transposase domain protein n=1 Tax=Tanacetum coccineum TaxID=301880 RepID=A0ABQ5E5J5_9ASTR
MIFISTTLYNLQNEPHFSNPYPHLIQINNINTDDVVNKNPQNKIHKWQKFMSFEPDIPETPVYKAKPNISKQYSKQSEVEKGMIFNNKESLILAVRLKALSEETKTQVCLLCEVILKQIPAFNFFCASFESITAIEKLGKWVKGEKRTRDWFLGSVGREKWSIVGIGGMSGLQECIGDNPNLLFISDRHAAIALAVEKEFPLAFHAAYTREDYATNMNTLQIVQPDAHEKLCRAGPQRWSRAHCPLVRYNYMTSNSVESVNACSVIYRKEPVLKLAETYRAMVQECKYDVRNNRLGSKQSGKKKMKSATWVVKGVNAYQYEVSDGQYIREVNLQTGICGCRKWQLSGLPCGHVIAITRFLGLTDCVHYVADWFKKPKYQATYSESIHSLGNMKQ